MVWTDRFLVFGSADIVRLRGKGVQEGHAELDYQVFRGVADADLVGRQLLQNELIYSGYREEEVSINFNQIKSELSAKIDNIK